VEISRRSQEREDCILNEIEEDDELKGDKLGEWMSGFGSRLGNFVEVKDGYYGVACRSYGDERRPNVCEIWLVGCGAVDSSALG